MEIPDLESLLQGCVIYQTLTIKYLSVREFRTRYGTQKFLTYYASEKYRAYLTEDSEFPLSLINERLSGISIFSLNGTVYYIVKMHKYDSHSRVIIVEEL